MYLTMYTHTYTNLMSGAILDNAAIVQSLTLIGLQGKYSTKNSTSSALALYRVHEARIL